METKDELLMKAVQADDEKAFEQLFFKYYESLCRFAYRYVHSMAIVEEFVQDIYATLWEQRTQLGKIEDIRPYLYKAVKNEALDYMKHEDVISKYEQEVEIRLYDEVYSTNKERITKEGFIEAAQNAIEELPEYTRHIYKMNRKEGLTYREISEILEISIKTVESHISKALRILRDRLAHYLPTLLLICVVYEWVA